MEATRASARVQRARFGRRIGIEILGPNLLLLGIARREPLRPAELGILRAATDDQKRGGA